MGSISNASASAPFQPANPEPPAWEMTSTM